MSVFTAITPEQLSAWLKNYSIGTLTRLEGIAAGIENTNYFVTTTHGRYVLTLFEKLKASELPFYLNLMAHLARHGIPSPRPIADLGGEYLGALNGKPASLVTCLPGADLAQVNAVHCATIGGLLAKMHFAGASYRAAMPNPRGPKWWRAAMPNVLPFLDQRATALLKEEIRVQSLHRFADLSRGVIHADLFRDNVLWNDDHVGGIIDFYFACNDVLLYDVAIAVNDWCIEADAALSPERTTALLAAYHRARPFTAIERDAWPVMLRAGALRFWISRLYDLYRPRPGLLTHAKDPQHFQTILERHIERAAELRQLLAQLR
jgi:homoserine kinase type II